jgi:hypothetical protein
MKNGEAARTSNIQLPTLNIEREKLRVIGGIVRGAGGQKLSTREKSLSASTSICHYEVKCSIERARNADESLCDHELNLIVTRTKECAQSRPALFK